MPHRPEVAERLGISDASVRDRKRDRALYGVTSPGGANRYPSWQFVAAAGDKTRTLPNLAKVLRVLPEHMHPLVVEEFFSKPREELVVGGDRLSPAAWLASGGAPEPVLEALAGEANLG